MFGIGWMELTMIGVVAILLFGGTLPKRAYEFGASIMKFKQGFADVAKEMEDGGNAAKEAVQEIEKTVKS